MIRARIFTALAGITAGLGFMYFVYVVLVVTSTLRPDGRFWSPP